MLQLIKRCPEYADGYKAYCQEAYDHNVVFFRPSNPKSMVQLEMRVSQIDEYRRIAFFHHLVFTKD